MRNDVKLGFAIGGVLLAVVIVFALVNSSSPKDPATDPTAQAEPNTATPPVTTETSKPAPTGATASATSTTPTNTTAGTTPADGTTVTPVEPFARSTTPTPAGQTTTDPWTDALASGKLPTLMNNQPTPAGNAGTPAGNGPVSGGSTETKVGPVTPLKPITAGSTPSDTNNGAAASNTPAVIGGGVNDRSAKGTQPDPRNQPDADRVLREYNATAGKTGTPTDTRAAGTSLSTPAKTVLTARTHTIKSGETFSTIATAYYGNIRHAKLIAKANPGVDSSKLKIGQVLNLPAYDGNVEAAATAKANTPAAIDGTRQYRVAQGDSLHSIAMKLYNDPKKVEAIYSANKAAIGDNPAKLKLGMVLQLPAQPAIAKK